MLASTASRANMLAVTEEMREFDIQSKGGIARAKALSPQRRKEIARKAAFARWRKYQNTFNNLAEAGSLVKQPAISREAASNPPLPSRGRAKASNRDTITNDKQEAK